MSDTNEKINAPDTVQVNSLMAESLLRDLLRERHTERRWKWIKRCAFSGAGLIMFGIAIYIQAKGQGFSFMTSDDVVAVVNLKGEIGPATNASAAKLIPILRKAFEAPNVKGIILHVDSGGGAPSESEQINQFIEMQKKKTKKKIVTVVTNIDASAAYMVSVHTDKIYCGRYSLVGSIGAIAQGWDFHKALERFDIHYRTYTSGDLKNMMSPYNEMSQAGDEKMHSMAKFIGQSFAREVKEQRKGKLRDDFNYFTGETWPGEQAKEIGLVDGFGTIEEVALKDFGYKPYEMGPNASGGFNMMGKSAGEFVKGFVGAFEPSFN